MLVIDGPRKGEWMALSRIAPVHYLRPRPWTALEFTPSAPREDDIRTLTPNRYRHPSWKVFLWLLSERGYSPDITPGTVLPGTIHGVELEQSPLCEVCRKHADTPTGRWCPRHLMEYRKGIGL